MELRGKEKPLLLASASQLVAQMKTPGLGHLSQLLAESDLE